MLMSPRLEALSPAMQMAVFLINTCKFNGCGLTFSTLGELIQHIEDTHIDSDPRILEKQELQQPPSLALSYVLKFFTDAARKENADLQKKAIRQRAQSPAVSIRSNTPTGSEFDDEEMVSEDDNSDDSWTTQEEFTTELILSMMSTKDGDGEKPFACPVPGCKKRYKNVNGIKYHAKNGHRKDTRVKKAYKCNCGKSYKTAQGLRNHTITHHHHADLLAMQRHKRAAIPLASPLTSPLTSHSNTSITIPTTVTMATLASVAMTTPMLTTTASTNLAALTAQSRLTKTTFSNSALQGTLGGLMSSPHTGVSQAQLLQASTLQAATVTSPLPHILTQQILAAAALE